MVSLSLCKDSCSSQRALSDYRVPIETDRPHRRHRQHKRHRRVRRVGRVGGPDTRFTGVSPPLWSRPSSKCVCPAPAGRDRAGRPNE